MERDSEPGETGGHYEQQAGSIFFLRPGVTGEVAKTLEESIGADLFEIKPKTPYTQADLNWMDQNARSTIEMSDPASRPEKVEGCKMHTNAKRLFSLLLAALLAASLSAPAASRALIVPRG